MTKMICKCVPVEEEYSGKKSITTEEIEETFKDFEKVGNKLILDRKPDMYGEGGEIVIAKILGDKITPYATWNYNPETKAFTSGHYHTKLLDAVNDFAERS